MNLPPPATPRGRFAPSPTGPLHAGSLLAALGSWLLARRAGGEWWLRIEDPDPPRTVVGAAQMQQAQLDACGLHPDGEVWWQSRRSAVYQRAIEALMDTHRAFECHCSRADLDAFGGVHRQCVPGRRRRDPSIRLRVPDGSVVAFDDRIRGRQEQDVAQAVGDVVLRRADGWYAYQLAVVVDDAVPAGEVLETCRQAGGKQLVNVSLFDVYQGSNLPEGKKSLAISLTIQDTEKTLEEKDINAVISVVLAELKQRFNAYLRD